MKRMKLVIMNPTHSSGSDSDADNGGGGGGGAAGGTNIIGESAGGNSRKYECDYCHTDFPNKTTLDRHTLFCKTLADIRRVGGGSGGVASRPTMATHSSCDDPLMPTPREMFVLIQELAMKYNKVKEELDVMKQWAKMVGRRIGGSGSGGAAGGGGGGAMAGLDFTSITRQKRQNMEVILNEEDAEHPDLAELRPGFAEWLTSPSLTLTAADLNIVFHEDLVAGITAAILRVLSEYTAESGKSHLIPFKLADIKQGGFYIFDTAFKVAAAAPTEIAPDLPTQAVVRRWRAMEPCEFQLMVRTFHKLLFKEFKKWQDSNWEEQRELTKQRQKAATSYQQMMSSIQQQQHTKQSVKYQCSPAMATSDGMYATPGEMDTHDEIQFDADDNTPTTPVVGNDPVLSEDFATLYNKYADKMMGGALSDEAIVTRVRAKLWKDMKAWRL